MILGPDGAKLSKRHGAASVLQYREGLPARGAAQLPRALGWSHGDQEIFSLDEMRRSSNRGRQQVGIGIQSGQARVAQPAAHHAAAPVRCSARSWAGISSASVSQSAEGAPLEAVIEAQRERS